MLALAGVVPVAVAVNRFPPALASAVGGVEPGILERIWQSDIAYGVWHNAHVLNPGVWILTVVATVVVYVILSSCSVRRQKAVRAAIWAGVMIVAFSALSTWVQLRDSAAVVRASLELVDLKREAGLAMVEVNRARALASYRRDDPKAEHRFQSSLAKLRGIRDKFDGLSIPRVIAPRPMAGIRDLARDREAAVKEIEQCLSGAEGAGGEPDGSGNLASVGAGSGRIRTREKSKTRAGSTSPGSSDATGGRVGTSAEGASAREPARNKHAVRAPKPAPEHPRPPSADKAGGGVTAKKKGAAPEEVPVNERKLSGNTSTGQAGRVTASEREGQESRAEAEPTVVSPPVPEPASGRQPSVPPPSEGEFTPARLKELLLKAVRRRDLLIRYIAQEEGKLKAAADERSRKELAANIAEGRSRLQTTEDALGAVFWLGHRRVYEYNSVTSTVYLRVGTPEESFARALAMRDALQMLVQDQAALLLTEQDPAKRAQINEIVGSAARHYRALVAALQAIFGITPGHEHHDQDSALYQASVKEAQESIRKAIENRQDLGQVGGKKME